MTLWVVWMLVQFFCVQVHLEVGMGPEHIGQLVQENQDMRFWDSEIHVAWFLQELRLHTKKSVLPAPARWR